MDQINEQNLSKEYTFGYFVTDLVLTILLLHKQEYYWCPEHIHTIMANNGKCHRIYDFQKDDVIKT